MARCDRCGAEVADEPKFCPACGAKFVPRSEPVSVEGDPGAYYCYKHKREITRITCGKCEKPICVKCLVVSPAGTRCRECARNTTPLSVRGILYDIGSIFGRIGTQRIWYFLALFLVLRFVMGCFR